MRILALVTDVSAGGGGIARYNYDLMSALARSPVISDILVLPRFTSADSVPMPAKVRQLAASSGRAAWSARALSAAMRERFDAVFCGHLNTAPLVAAIARLRRTPLWLQVHGIEAWQPRGGAYNRALGQARLVTSVSRFTRQRLLTWADITPDRVRVLPNTVASRYTPRPRRSELVARHGLFGKSTILTVGQLSASERYKGHDRIIAAMPRVLASVPHAAYLIVGSGDDRPRLEQIAVDCAVDEHVVFAGHVPRERSFQITSRWPTCLPCRAAERVSESSF